MGAWMRLLAVAAFAMTSSGSVHAAQWAKTYLGPGNSSFDHVRPTADGGHIVSGRSYIPPTSSGVTSAPQLIKLDADGNVRWNVFYVRDGLESFGAVQPTTDGGYVAAGNAYFGGTIDEDAWVVKVDATGSIAWQYAYGGAKADGASDVQQTADGGYVVAGYTTSFGAGSFDGWILKIDAAGSVLWQKAYGGMLDDLLYSILPTADGGYVAAGKKWSFDGSEYHEDFWVLKLDADGGITWQKTYGGTGSARANAIALAADGGYAIAGNTFAFGAGRIDAWVLKLDAAGNLVWQVSLGGSGADDASSIDTLDGGGYVVSGFHEDPAGADGAPQAGGKAWVLILDATGNVVRQTSYRVGELTAAASGHPTSDGGYFTVGFAFRPYVAWALKLDADGGIAGCSLGTQTRVSAVPTTATARDATAVAVATDAVPKRTSATVWGYVPSVQTQCYDPSPASRMTAVEYLHRDFGHYFVTAARPEIAALDAGTFPGWARTGHSFRVYGLDPGAASVCRFWSGQTFLPKSSHFYTPYGDECAFLTRQGVWQYEGDVFAVGLPTGPAGLGVCGAATQPLYRAYNDGKGGAPNHRYTTDPALLDAMIAQGWVMEGEAITRVFACVPR